MPWNLLLDAAGRDITVAVILDRVADGVVDEVAADLRAMLERQGLGESQLFIVPESDLDEFGMLPAESIAQLEDWLARLAGDTAAHSAPSTES